MADASIQLTLSHHETTQGLAYQLITIELVSCDRIIEPKTLATLRLPAGLEPRKGVVLSGRVLCGYTPTWSMSAILRYG